jgi:hypothetical protein
MYDSIYDHYRENQGEVAVRVPEERTRPLFGGIVAQQADRHVDQDATQDYC